MDRVRLDHRIEGSGPRLVLVHGSWGDLETWTPAMPLLSEHFTVLRYSRRGHGASESTPHQGSAREDADDLDGLLQELGWTGAMLVGNSWGAVVALTQTITRPASVSCLSIHEPPLFGIDPHNPSVQGPLALVYDIHRQLGAGDVQGAVGRFVDEVAVAPGAWSAMDPVMRERWISLAPTWYDELSDPDFAKVDRAAIAACPVRVQVTRGDHSAAFLQHIAGLVAATLPNAELRLIPGAGHMPYLTHPRAWVDALVAFEKEVSAGAGSASSH